jgi:hypothetical protein
MLKQVVHIITTFLQRDKKDKAIPVTGHGSPYGCETLRPPHFLDSQLTDDSEVSFPGRFLVLISVRG